MASKVMVYSRTLAHEIACVMTVIAQDFIALTAASSSSILGGLGLWPWILQLVAGTEIKVFHSVILSTAGVISLKQGSVNDAG